MIPVFHVYVIAILTAVVSLIVGIGWARNRPTYSFSGSDMLRNAFDSTMPANQWRATVNPWDMQRDLMEASAQDLPMKPMLTHGALLYAALNMEEQAETLEAMADALRDHFMHVPFSCTTGMNSVCGHLEATSAILASNSGHLRALLSVLTLDPIELTDAQAVALLDGVTDVAVVNCGLALAMGFDGSAAYEEVGLSNLSKANPLTGKIDKTLDGKWIKGTGFYKPNLQRVIERTQATRETQAEIERVSGLGRAAAAHAMRMSPSA